MRILAITLFLAGCCKTPPKAGECIQHYGHEPWDRYQGVERVLEVGRAHYRLGLVYSISFGEFEEYYSIVPCPMGMP